MKKIFIGTLVVLMLAAMSLIGEATGAGIRAEVYNELPSYRVGETITFEFGGAAIDPGGADNIATFIAIMPDGVVVKLVDVYIPNSTQFIFYVDYIVKLEDVKYTVDNIPFVRASLEMAGTDTDLGGFKFYAEASAAINLEAPAEVPPALKVKKASPRNPKSYK